MHSSRPLDFYFDFVSAYGYLASLEIEAIAARHGRRVNWHCMLLGVAVIKVMRLKPLGETPLKGDYARLDFAREVRRRGLNLARNPTDPVMNPLSAARAFYWVKRHHPELQGAFASAVLDAYWRAGRDMASISEILEAARPLGIDPQAFVLGLHSIDTRNDLREAVSKSLARGVFGSPFVFVDDEPFWGSDRLAMVDTWLMHGGW